MAILDFPWKTGDIDVHFAKFEFASSSTALDGNIHLDVDTKTLYIFDNTEVPNIRTGVVNPIEPGNDGGITMRAILAYFQVLSKVSETFRRYKSSLDIVFIDTNSYATLNGIKINSAHNTRIKNSAIEVKTTTVDSATEVYFIGVSNNGLEDTHQGYYLFGEDGIPVQLLSGKFNYIIEIPETARSEEKDMTFYFRKVGYFPQKFSLSQINYIRAGAFTVPVLLDSIRYTNWVDSLETELEQSNSKFDDIKIEKLTNSMSVSGLGSNGNETGTFSVVIRNPNSLSLDEISAWVLYQQNKDEAFIYDETSQANIDNIKGRRINMIYELGSSGEYKYGKLNIDGTSYGIFIENLSTTDKLRIRYTDDSDNILGNPYLTEVLLNFAPNADFPVVDKDYFWFQVFVNDGEGGNDFNTANAITFKDINDNEVKGVYDDLENDKFSFIISLDSDSLLGADNTIVVRSGGLLIKQSIVSAILSKTPLIEVPVNQILLQQ